jgi:hypothetical protein
LESERHRVSHKIRLGIRMVQNAAFKQKKPYHEKHDGRNDKKQDHHLKIATKKKVSSEDNM